ncbi:pilus assembly protein PilM [Ureibacillus sp. FSL K6-8385]|uniref:type IV pilus biogenesis protein PilM n=1 Tax=Ureibacillus TaxID=160795 RepID=UPI002E23A6B0|nr:pilus assembly protein PilM [Ureibacillus terrenus]MED3762668.1 pilus assembly protein PilM [Ureibacillus terrenus]
MFRRKNQSHVSIEINDYVLRSLVMKGPDLSQAEVMEIAIPEGVIDESEIKDEMALFDLLKELSPLWRGKKQSVRFIVPDSFILLKAFEHPDDVETEKLKEYVEMEIGYSIHLPFEEPLIDVYDPVEGDGKAMMFAASSEQVTQYINLFLDVHMRPEVADVRALCHLRLLESMNLLNPEKTYLLTNWLINGLSITIYSKGNVEFQRFQPLETDLSKWKAEETGEHQVDFSYDGPFDEYRLLVSDQMLELDRIMDFFRFSVSKDQQGIDEIIVMGDNPNLNNIHSQLQENFELPIKLINDSFIQKHYPGFKAKHAALLGLALKEVK